MTSDYSENELYDIIERMGQHVTDPISLHKLKNEIDKILDGISSSDGQEDDLNQSLFASLCIDSDSTQNNRQSDYCPSPIVNRRRRGNHEELVEVEYPDDFEADEEKTDSEVNTLIAEAYKSIGRIYNTCRNAENVSRSMSSADDEEQEDEQNCEIIDEEIDIPASDSEGTQPVKPIIIDPSVRPVLDPKPGRAPYKEEWKRHPAPGEMRRLSLRWKVREFMLRSDLPRLNANPDARVEHPKDWSPKPYMD
ncbi:unnamed protein product [Caenorhabditis bovis]|uniref:Centriolar and ciliogenesis-associated protein HYLS1 C-terminal domain-containing protein n=1 Tax=Caenorhabditis bovis TaxID=2654633 RepID=A0A8S1ECY2_9PELO|nr:unnamed protein product [Caenorhabditis bovis]